MKRIEDITELRLSSGSGSVRKRGNLYMMTKDLREYIGKGQLYSLLAENGLGLVLQSEGRKKFCFRADEQKISEFICEFEPNETYVSELVFPRGHPERCNAERQVLEAFGFKLASQAMLMGAAKEIIMSRSSPICAEGYSVRRARPEDFSELIPLLCASLDPMTDDLELGRDLLKTIEDGMQWVVVSPDGAICGCMARKTNGRNAMYRHIVVSAGHRRRGLTKAMFYNIAREEPPGTMVHLWVKKDNLPSQAMMISVGCTVEQREMEIWIR